MICFVNVSASIETGMGSWTGDGPLFPNLVREGLPTIHERPRRQALIPQNCLVRLQHLRPSWLVSVLAYL